MGLSYYPICDDCINNPHQTCSTVGCVFFNQNVEHNITFPELNYAVNVDYLHETINKQRAEINTDNDIIDHKNEAIDQLQRKLDSVSEVLDKLPSRHITIATDTGA